MRDKWLWLRVAVGAVLLAANLQAATDSSSDAQVPFSTDGRAEITQLPPAPVIPKSADDLKAIQSRVEAVVKEALPATVAILLDDAQGSGVIVSKDGYVLTAGHVSGKPGQFVTVVLANGKELQAKSLGANNNIDSGMIKILDKPPVGGPKGGGFPFVPLGSDKELKAGEWVVALGHPGGYHEGRPPVVRLGRVLLANHQMIGTDCPLISGDSGGPVLDLDGRLIGINSRIGGSLTTNIHVPIDTFEETWDRLAKSEEWGGTSGLLGHHGGGDEIPAEGASLGINGGDAPSGGALVRRVYPHTSAEMSGLRAGDVVVSFDGKTIDGVDALAERVDAHSPGDVVKIVVIRDEKRVEVKVTLGALR